jgi:hypothetical protein
MKKTLTILILSAATTAAFAQGIISFFNTATTTFQTNLLAFGGNPSGSAVSEGGPYYYEVLTARSTVTTVDANLQQLLTATWSDTGIEATNTAVAGHMTGSTATNGGAIANFWPAGTTNSFIVVGWSGNLGSTRAQVAPQLAGAQLAPANGGFYWLGNFAFGFGGSFLGATSVGFRQAGGVVGPNTYPSPILFGAVPDLQGNPITTPTTLWPIAIPEPSSFALTGLAAAVLSVFRRRKSRRKG